jgi:hemerythrin superfamily protein
MSPHTKLDAIALLKSDHRKVEGLFKKFEATKAAAKKQTLVHQICTELLVHTMIEEEMFYPACKAAGVEEDDIEEAYVEHDGAKVLIAELLASSPAMPFYDAKVKVLAEQIKHHVKEEEQRSEGLFAEARAAGVELAELGEQMMARKKELLRRFQASGLPAPETRSFTGHEMRQGHPAA